MKSLKKMNLIDMNLTTSLRKIKKMKEKTCMIKKDFLENSAKLLLFKIKIKNLQKIQILLKDYIFYWSEMLKNIKNLKKEQNIGLRFEILVHINKGIKNFFGNKEIKDCFFNTNINKNKKKENTNNNNNININNNNNNKTIKLIDILYEKCQKKLNKIKDHFEKNFSNIFKPKEKKLNYLNFFYYQLILNKGDSDIFLKLFIENFKKNIKISIKNSLAFFNDENRGHAIRNLIRLRDLSTIKFEENRLTQGINLALNDLIDIINNFKFYIELHKK